MNKSDLCIYSYLFLLSACCVFYAFYVVIGGGAYAPAININVVLRPDIALNSSELPNQLPKIEDISVHGVVIDVWWGLVETQPQEYDWSAYTKLFALVNHTKLKVKVVFAFHAYSNNIVNISLPSWVLNISYSNPDIFYRDQHTSNNTEYLTSGVDHMPLFPPGRRSAVEMYSDFVQDFANTFSPYFDTLIYEVQVGLGPQGELRYPSFSQTWEFPGIGEFQCYDKYLMQEYSNTANKTNNPLWSSPPTDVEYNDTPGDSKFFSPGANNYQSKYGQFFLNWYSNRLIQHGKSVLSQVSSILSGYSPNITVAAKLGCVYWQYKDSSHAAEQTAGYSNYTLIAQMFYNFGIIMDFSCFELRDSDASLIGTKSGPQELVYEILQIAQATGISIEGQNSNTTFDSYDQIEADCRRDILPIVGFDFNVLSDELVLDDDNFNSFKKFVNTMSNPAKVNQ